MPTMARFGRAKKSSRTNNDANSTLLVAPTSDLPQPPRVNLPHVETELNMHQYNGLFGIESPEQQREPTVVEPSAGWLSPSSSASLTTVERADSNPKHSPGMRIPTEPVTPPSSHHTHGSPNHTNGDASGTEWSSAVGHAATGKSGRVIHNLQEDIARLTRECGVYRSRAEETQRMNDVFKTQVHNMTERLRNLEQANDTNLQSITRKDRKLDELRAEAQAEKDRRLRAEGETSKANRLMNDTRDEFNRQTATLQETAQYYQSQYDVLAKSGQRERADQQKRLKTIRDDYMALKKTHDTRDVNLQRYDELLAEKDREIEAARAKFDQLFQAYESYRTVNDEEMRTLIENGRQKEAALDAALASLKETEGRMKWVMRVKDEVKGAE